MNALTWTLLYTNVVIATASLLTSINLYRLRRRVFRLELARELERDVQPGDVVETSDVPIERPNPWGKP